MRFWDSSAVLPILVTEPKSKSVTALLREDRECWTWWATRTECFSGLHRQVRARDLTVEEFATARERLILFDQASSVVLPSEAIRARADRLLGIHPLRTSDALQLAAALSAAEENPGDVPFVTLDERLAEAARKEGFPILPE